MNNNQLTRWEDFGPRQRPKKSCLQKPFEDELELERRMFVFEYRLEKQITYMFFLRVGTGQTALAIRVH